MTKLLLEIKLRDHESNVASAFLFVFFFIYLFLQG